MTVRNKIPDVKVGDTITDILKTFRAKVLKVDKTMCFVDNGDMQFWWLLNSTLLEE